MGQDMSIFSRLAAAVFSGTDLSTGAARQISPAEAAQWGTEVEYFVSAIATNAKIYASLSALNADLSPASGTLAWVLGDATAANNGIYRKSGGSGAGLWVYAGGLPYSTIFAVDAGAGTANALQATSAIPIQETALVAVNVFEANTASPVTISFNGGTALTIKTNTGNNIAAGGLVAGMQLLGRVVGTTFRLLTDQVDAAIVAAAEAAQAAAEAAAAAALSAVPNAFPLTLSAAKALDTDTITSLYLLETPRAGQFQFLTGDYSALVTADTQGMICFKADDKATSVGAWVRVYSPREFEVGWTGASGAIGDNSTLVQAAIDMLDLLAGGTLYFGAYLQCNSGIIVNGDDMNLVGRDRSSGLYTNTAGKQLLKITGSRCSMSNMIINMPVFTSTASDYLVWLENVVQFRMEHCKLQGGYHCLMITGGTCTDNWFVDNVYIYATGTAMVRAVDSTGGANGAHHFLRCLFNQPYGTGTPNGTDDFKGVRANTTAYGANDVVSVGNYYLQCATPGTSGASPPTVNVWYNIDIADGTVVWRLVARSDYTGLELDTNTYYCTVEKCDFTGPFAYARRVRNSLTGTKPRDHQFIRNTAHGVIEIIDYMESANQCLLERTEGWNPTNNLVTTYGIFVSSDCDNIEIVNPQVFRFTNGIYIAGDRTKVRGGAVTGHTSASVRIAAGTDVAHVDGTNLGYTDLWGASANAVIIEVGNSDYCHIVNNEFVGASAGLTNGATGVNNTISGNT